ncbi:MAG TPA: YraN family protein [Actinomycetes bacterium]|nr:YraN family protein [Actinomycetes bacterium]
MRAKDVLGQYGERLAEAHLVGQGMVVLDRNWRCELGEIDLVARDGDALVVCEVKTRSGLGFGHPLETVTAVKLARLRRLAVRWVADHGVHPPQIRLDVVGVLRRGSGPAQIEHVRGVG